MAILDGLLGNGLGGIVPGGTNNNNTGNSSGGGLLGGVIDTVDDILDDLLGGVGGTDGGGAGGGGTGGTGSGGAGGGTGGTGGGTGSSGGTGGGTGSGSGGIVIGDLINTRLLDGQINLKLLSDDTILNLSLLDEDDDGDGLVDLSLLDPDADGLIDVGLLDDKISVSVIDPDGNGLIDVDILDLIDVDVGGDVGGDDDGGGDDDDDNGSDPDDDDVDGGTGPGPGNPPNGGSTDRDDYEEVLIGTPNRDNFVIGNETTFVDGLAEVDVASYGTDTEGFTYKTTQNGVFIIEDGTKIDYLQDVERVKFTDGTLVLDTDVGENAGMAYRIYQAAFDRTPDVPGLKYWIAEIDRGFDFTKVADSFLLSNEFKQTYGTNLSNEQFLDKLYENILGRNSDAAGYDYWIDELNSGESTRGEVLASFSESEENVALVAPAIQDGFFLA